MANVMKDEREHGFCSFVEAAPVTDEPVALCDYKNHEKNWDPRRSDTLKNASTLSA